MPCPNVGVFPVQFPLQGIVDDVLPDAVERFFITDDVFVVIPLPNASSGCTAHGIDTFGGLVFEIGNHLS